MVQDATPSPAAALTARQQEVLELLRLGLTNGEIAERLGISLRGAELHVSEVIGRLGVRNRHEAAYWPERPPWWAAGLAPIALFLRRAGAALPLKASSAAAVASGGAFLAAMAGLGLIAVLLTLGDGDRGGPAAVAGAPVEEGTAFEEATPPVDGAASAQLDPPPPTMPAARSASTGESARPFAPALPQSPDTTPEPCPAEDCPAPPDDDASPAAPTPVPTPFGSGAMAVDCDAATPGVQSACSYAPGETFQIELHVLYPPAGGYDAFQADFQWGGDVLVYRPAASPLEGVGRACEIVVQFDSQISGEPKTLFGCLRDAFAEGNLTESGPVLRMAFQCEQPGASPLELLSPRSAPQGTYFSRSDVDDAWPVIEPAYTNASVACDSCPPGKCDGLTSHDAGEVALDCDGAAAGVQTACSYEVGEVFGVHLHVTRPPDKGYVSLKLALARVDGPVVVLEQGRPWSAPWEACSWPFPNLGTGAEAGLVSMCAPPVSRVSTFTGGVLEIQAACRREGLALLRLLPEGPFDTVFLDGLIDWVRPAVRPAGVTCVASTDTPTPTATPPGGAPS